MFLSWTMLRRSHTIFPFLPSRCVLFLLFHEAACTAPETGFALCPRNLLDEGTLPHSCCRLPFCCLIAFLLPGTLPLPQPLPQQFCEHPCLLPPEVASCTERPPSNKSCAEFLLKLLELGPFPVMRDKKPPVESSLVPPSIYLQTITPVTIFFCFSFLLLSPGRVLQRSCAGAPFCPRNTLAILSDPGDDAG